MDDEKAMLIIAKNILLLLSSQAGAQVFNFVSIALIARALGAAAFGHLILALVVTKILTNIADLGIRKVQAREMTRDCTPDYTSRVLGTKLPLDFVLLALSCLGWLALEKRLDTLPIALWTSAAALFSSLSQAHYAASQANDRYGVESSGYLARGLILLSGALMLSRRGANAAQAAALYAIAEGACLAWSFRVPNAAAAWPPTFDSRFITALIRDAAPFGLTGAFETIYHWLDSVMLRTMRDSLTVGLYGSAYRLFLVALQVPSAVNIVLHPVMSRLVDDGHEGLSSIFGATSRYLSGFGVLSALFVATQADRLMTAVFGKAFLPGVPALRLLSSSIVLVGLNSPFVRRLETCGKEGMVSRICGFSAVVNILLNLMLIPRWGMTGAAAATVASEAVITTGVIIALKDDPVISWRQLRSIWFRIAAAALIGGAPILLRPGLPGEIAGLTLCLSALVGFSIWPASEIREFLCSLRLLPNRAS